MRNLYKVLLVIAVVGAGAVFYAKKKNVDLKTLFRSECDCHASGCDLKSSTLPTSHHEPANTNTQAPHINVAEPAHQASTQSAHAVPVAPAKAVTPVRAVAPAVPAKPALAPAKA